MTKEALLQLKNALSNEPTADFKLMIREVIEWLLVDFDSKTLDDIFFAMSCIGKMPSVLYDKVTDTYLCTPYTHSHAIDYMDELITIYSFYTHDDDGWQLDLRVAVKKYVEKLYMSWL